MGPGLAQHPNPEGGLSPAAAGTARCHVLCQAVWDLTYLKWLGGFCHRVVAEAGAQKQLLGRHWFGWAGRGQLDWMEEDPFRHGRVRSAHGIGA